MGLRIAIAEVFRAWGYRAAGGLIMLSTAVVLAWTGQVVLVFPEGGVFVNADGWTLMALAGASVLLGVTVPLHWYAWRRAQGTASAQGMGALGALFSVGALSCCAPLLLPGLLSLVGFSGTTLLSLNLRLHQWRLPLTLAALAFLLLSLWMGQRNVARSCALPGRGSAAA